MSCIIQSAWGVEWNDESLLDLLLDLRTSTEVLMEGGEVIGYMCFEKRGCCLFVNSIQLKSGYRGMGLGRLMMDRLEMHAHDRLLDCVDLWVQTTNDRAFGFYSHLGYQQVMRRGNNLLMRKRIQSFRGSVRRDVRAPA